jgi:hypothetical protein
MLFRLLWHFMGMDKPDEESQVWICCMKRKFIRRSRPAYDQYRLQDGMVVPCSACGMGCNAIGLD